MPFHASIHLVDVDVCRPEKCPGCDPQEDCVVVAVSNKVTEKGPLLYVNKHGGDLDMWITGITLTNWTLDGEHATSVLCLGDFVLVVSNPAGGVYYTDDLGVTLVEHTETDWATNGPNSADAIDQSFIVMVNDSGHIWGSYDAARTWEILDDANATVRNLHRVMIARDNPQVIYAIGESSALVKTENGGQNWFTQPGPGVLADNLKALWVKDQFHVLIINDEAEVWETSDGGETWAQQDALPNLAAVPVGRDMMGCGCDGLWAAIGHSGAGDTATGHRIYRNVDGGASGRWYIPTEVQTPTYQPRGLACCDINRAVIVGGYTTDGNVILVA